MISKSFGNLLTINGFPDISLAFVYTKRFRVNRLRPLGHLSARESIIHTLVHLAKSLFNEFMFFLLRVQSLS